MGGRLSREAVGPPGADHTRRLSCLLVGLGDRAQRVLVPALANCGVRIADVVDPAARQLDDAFHRARARGHLTPGARLLPAFPDRVDRYDIAVVAVPHGAHETVARRLTDGGCPVLKEKPYARTLEEARRLHRHCGSLLHPLVDRPQLPVFRLLTRLLPRLGPRVRFRARYWRPCADYRRSWRNDPRDAGAGVLLDMGYHCLDILLRLLGHPGSVVITHATRRRGYAVDEQVRLLCEHPAGRGAVEVSRLAEQAREQYTFVGAGAMIRAGLSFLEFRLPDGTRWWWRFSDDPVLAATRTLRRAIADLASPGRVLRENAHGLRVMTVIDRAHRGRDTVPSSRQEAPDAW